MSSRHPLAVPTEEPRWPKNVPDAVWATLVGAILILIAGALGYAAKKPWLFASLGPTAFMVTETPNQPSSRFYNMVVGHLSGTGAGVLAAWLVGAASTPGVTQIGYPAPAHIWAAAIAIALTMFLGSLLHASHPPAAATTLLFALGMIKPNVEGVVSVIAGVLILAVFGEAARVIRLGRRPNLSDFLPS